MSYSSRPLLSLKDDLDGLQVRFARLADMSYGLAMIFGALALVSATGGVWLDQPLLATSSGFAIVATAAFGLWGYLLSRACAQRQHLRPIPIIHREDRRWG
jgi:hypothetical protein